MARASIGLTTADAAGGMHVRAWEVPADWADGFAARATALFGEPSEMVGDVAAMVASAASPAAMPSASSRSTSATGSGSPGAAVTSSRTCHACGPDSGARAPGI